MAALEEKLSSSIPGLRKELQSILKQHGPRKLTEATVEQAVGGLRSVHGLLCDTSEVDPNRGLLIRGRPISELTNMLPEEIFYFLLTGDMPDTAALKSLQADFRKRADVPEHVWTVINAVAEDAHPMRVLSIATLSLGTESVFRKRYDEGKKDDSAGPGGHADASARLPQIAAAFRQYKLGRRIVRSQLDCRGLRPDAGPPDPKGDLKNSCACT